jgi:predicted short-subunit dehydrogenase-like oxidoreductase (DUF2520 family)
MAVDWIGAGVPSEPLSAFTPADLYFFGTPDDQIEASCNQLLTQHVPPIGSLFVHFSGLHTSDLLKRARDFGCWVASLHPIQSFANPAISTPIQDDQDSKEMICAYEGDPQAYPLLHTLFSKLNARFLTLHKDKKAIYHAASVFCCNYAVTLAHIATQCYTAADLPDTTAQHLILRLMHNAMDNIAITGSAQQALTGPLERGDLDTISQHLAALDTHTPYGAVYRELAHATLELATGLSKMQQERLMDVLAR